VERLFTLGLANAAAATALAFVVALVARCLRGRPVMAHCLWLLVMVKLVTPPLFQVPVPGGLTWTVEAAEAADPGRSELVAPATIVPIEVIVDDLKADAPSDGDQAAAPGLFGSWELSETLKALWLCGSGLVLALAAVRIVRFRRLLRRAEPAPEGVQDQVLALGRRLGLSQAPETWQIDLPLVPMLWSLGGRPRLILPLPLWKRLDARQRTLLLVHELAHLRRGDHYLRLFELAITVAFWWLPTVWWARRRLREAEEECCDAWVVWAYPDEARKYAETLLDTVDFLDPVRSAVPLLASGFGRAHHLSLRRRLTMIMLGTTPRRLGLAGALVAFGFAAFLLPLSPTWAQDPAEKATTESFFVNLKTGELPDEPLFYNFKIDDPAKPADVAQTQTQVRVVVADGNDVNVQEVRSDSIDKAIAELKNRVDALAKEEGSSEKHGAEIKALKQAIEQLQKTAPKALVLKRVEVAGDPRKIKEDQKHVVVLRGKLSAENQARLAKAKARIAALQKELAVKQKQLAEAQADLAKLSLPEHQYVIHSDRPRIEPPAKEDEHAEHPEHGQRLELRLHSAGPDTSDHARLEALEKKLSKLLDEVASLRGRGDSKADRAK
jgi:beta-lactamase regulating signal transducer with metallopeptidase domain